MSQLKQINYRGGALRFSVPSHWVEEYGEKSGGTFYENEPEAGTLRLSVLVFPTTQKADTDALVAFLKKLPESKTKGSSIKIEKNGNVVLQFIQRQQEDGEPVSLVFWMVANSDIKDFIQVASFSYTLMNRNLAREQNQEDITLLDETLRQTEFLGVPQTLLKQ